jgi:hypothetical protein
MPFVRHADDFVINIISGKDGARQTLSELNTFITQTLKVELAAF